MGQESVKNFTKVSKDDESSSSSKLVPTIKKSNAIVDVIGEGDAAKNSIIWVTIRWCLVIPTIITVLFFISLWISYGADNPAESESIKDYIIKTWSIFAPIITLALGYLYGKHSPRTDLE